MAMRSEQELRAVLAQLIEEHSRAIAEMTPEPIRVNKVGEAVYEISLRQIAANTIISINTLRWALGEIDLPNANKE